MRNGARREQGCPRFPGRRGPKRACGVFQARASSETSWAFAQDPRRRRGWGLLAGADRNPPRGQVRLPPAPKPVGVLSVLDTLGDSIGLAASTDALRYWK